MNPCGITLRSVLAGSILVGWLAACGSAPPPLALEPGSVVRQRLDFDASGKVGLWVSQPYYDYIFGQTANGETTVVAIDTKTNNCLSPSGMKVDAQRNLWVACASTDSGYGAVQEYEPGSSALAAIYADELSCGSDCYYHALPEDVAFDRDGHIFAADPTIEYCYDGTCKTYAGISWWDVSPASGPTFFKDPNLLDVYTMDADPQGNLYVAGYGCVQSKCGNMVDEIAKPTKQPVFVTVLPPNSLEADGGVYVSNHGKVLNVTDALQRLTFRYKLPFVSSETQFQTLGPTLLNHYGYGQPAAGSLNETDTRIALGDDYGWIDVGIVASNKWKAVSNYNFTREEIFAAAYTPSDK